VRLGPPIRRTAAAVAVGSLVASAAQAAPAPPAPVRSALETLARQLEGAVSRVSPSAQVFTGGPDSTQALRVGGIGVVIVLPARALPLQRRPMSVRARAREQQAASEPAPPAAPPRIVALGPTPAPRALEQLERELDHEMAMRTRLLQAMQQAQVEDDALLQRALEVQMLAVREQAEAFRIEVERARQRADREVRVQLGAIARAPSAPPSSVPPAGDAARAPEAPAAAGPAAPAEPPWPLWGGAPAEAAQLNKAAVDQVQEALVSALEAHGAELRGLAAQETVTVAVDFVSGGPFGLRPRVRATLVVRAMVGDVQARAAGRLSSADFRQRVQARQY